MIHFSLRQLRNVLVCSGLIVVLASSSVFAIGVPTGKLGNRFYTYPDADFVYGPQKQCLKSGSDESYSVPYYKEGKVWVSSDEELEESDLLNDPEVLQSQPPKTTTP